MSLQNQTFLSGRSMTTLAAHPDKNHVSAITSLCSELEFSTQEVAAVYKQEFDRLAAEARIPNFLDVLAMRSTRSILRRVRSRVISN
jgi:hypothetical protein